MQAHKWRHDLIFSALDGDYLSLKVIRLALLENMEKKSIESDDQAQETTACEVSLTVTIKQGSHDNDPTSPLTLTGQGVGLIDAGFEALVNHFADKYPSLKSIQFASFDVRGEAEQSPRAGADGRCVARLVIKNSDNEPLEFEDSGRSMAAVSLQVVLSAVEHFINAEKAFISIYKALQDARNRGRQDLVEGFTSKLSELVKTTSYTEVIARLRSEINL